MRRLFTLTLAVFVLVVAPAGAQPENAGGGANHVVLVSTTGENAVHERSGLQIVSAGGDAVGSENVALARSTSCTDCRTVAVAVQVVFATGEPHVVTNGNFAFAVNADCTRCATYAYAYQYLLTTGGPVHLSAAGNQRVAELRQEISALAGSGLPFEELTSRLDARTEELKALVDAELIHAGKPAGGTVAKHLEAAPAG